MVNQTPDPQGNFKRIYISRIDVAKRLDELGLREATLIRAAMTGIQYWLDATEHSCRTALGMVIWNFATQALRDLLVTEGWSKENTLNYELTVHPSGSHALAVSSGDKRTGDEEHTPCTNEKGKCTRDAIERNLQLSFARISPSDFPPDDDEEPDTWLLMYHIDAKKEEIRIELSRPDGLNADNEINSWSERIVLTAQPFGAVPTTKSQNDDDDDTDEIDFDVDRKTG